MLYQSLHEKLLRLPDETEIFPAHGAGSLCGRQMSAERSSTIGKERRTNYALQAPTCQEFIHLLTDSLPPRPEYFGREVELNRQGAAALDQLPPPAPAPAKEVLRLQSEGAIVLDTRPAMQFAVAHVPGSLHIATLFDRPYRRLVDDLPVRYVGFTIPDEFFVGYGFALDNRYRNLRDLRIVRR